MTEEEITQCANGLGGADDWFFRGRLERRAAALRDDEPTFGLVPSEKRELARIDAILDGET